MVYLAITVLATIMLYYELYIARLGIDADPCQPARVL